jgi:hypothetical protein
MGTLGALSADLRLWSGLKNAEKEDLARELTNLPHLRDRGLRYLGLQTFSDGSAHRGAVWGDDRAAMHWVLVPSGTFCPGYSESKREALSRQAFLSSEAAMELPDAQPPPSVEDIIPYGAWGGWSADRLYLRGPVSVEPLLMSVLPVLQSTPGVQFTIDTTRNRMFMFDARLHRPLAVAPESYHASLIVLAGSFRPSANTSGLFAVARRSSFPGAMRYRRS